MLDDNAGGSFKLAHAGEGRIRIHDVVVGKRLALNLLGRDQRTLLHDAQVPIEFRRLMGVLAVPQRLRRFEGGPRRRRSRQVLGDRLIVAAGACKCLGGEQTSQLLTHAARLNLFENLRVVRGINHHGHEGLILGGTSNQAGTANVDVINCLAASRSGILDHRLKGIQIHNHQVDRLYTVFAHGLVVDTTTRQYSAVDLRMKCLDPTFHHLRETGVVRDIPDPQAKISNRPRSASRCQDFHIQGR